METLRAGGGYYGASSVILDYWARIYSLSIAKPIQNIIAQHTKIPDTFCVEALETLDLETIPIEAADGNKVITYCKSRDLKEIFVPLSLQINSSRNVGIYEISFNILALTLQGIKFGLVSSYSQLYRNPNVCAHDVVGGYIGIFNERNNNAIVCWDGFTQNTIKNNQWNQSYSNTPLQKSDTIVMIIDTKYKLMHLRLKKHNYNNVQLEHEICCVSYQDLIKKNNLEMNQVTPCVSLLFHKDSIQLSSIRHYIFKQHEPEKCPVHKNIQTICKKDCNINFFPHQITSINFFSHRMIIYSLLVVCFSVYCLFVI